MNVTANVINDLLPLYASGECSADSKALVEQFLKENPAFTIPTGHAGKMLDSSPGSVGLQDEMRTFKATRRRLKVRSSIMGLAIFFTIAPFSFAYVHGHFYSLISESPTAAAVYGSIGVIFWGVYLAMKRGSGNI